MYQRHVLVVTSEKVWTTIPTSFQKTDDEICRLCDVHLLYICRDTCAVLKPVFEWKHEVPLVSLLTPKTNEPLEDTMDTQLTKEQNEQNRTEIKQEQGTLIVPENINVQDQLRLINVPALPDPDCSLPDATINLLVDFPGVKGEPIDATRSVPTVDEEGEPMDTTKKSGANVEDEEFVMPSQQMWKMRSLLCHHKLKHHRILQLLYLVQLC